MAERIAGSRLIEIKDAGHMMTLEKPDEVTDALRGWLGDAARELARRLHFPVNQGA
jgi:pimeloyl-ACP methyl ester carboxylesterase